MKKVTGINILCKRSFDDMCRNEEICDYCKWTDFGRLNNQIACYGGEPIMCEGRYCDEAYEYYLENCEGEEDEDYRIC